MQLPYRHNFRAAQIDGHKLIELTEDELTDLGVSESSHLLRLLSHIAVFRSQLGRTLLVAEGTPADSPLSQGVAADGSFSWFPALDELDRRMAGPERGATTSNSRRTSANTRRSASRRVNSAPGIGQVASPGVSLARGMERQRSPKRQPSPRPQTARGAGKPAVPTQRRARSAERGGQRSAAPSSWQTPQKQSSTSRPGGPADQGQAWTPVLDSRPPLSTPATSSTWSPLGSGEAWHHSPKPSSVPDPSSLLMPSPWSGPATGPRSSPEHSSQDGRQPRPRAATSPGGPDAGGNSADDANFVPRPRSTTSPGGPDAWGNSAEDANLAARARSAPRLSRPDSSSSFSAQRTPRLDRTRRDVSFTSTKSSPVVNSEFGRDQRKGAHFLGSDRRLLDPPVKSSQGPEYYQEVGSHSALAKTGISKFGSDKRRTLECMYTIGQAGPGGGRYDTSSSGKKVRGGSMGSASRFRGKTPSQIADKTPGPYAYTPTHHYLSGFK